MEQTNLNSVYLNSVRKSSEYRKFWEFDSFPNNSLKKNLIRN